MNRNEKLLKAAILLELELPASYAEIKTQYKNLLKKWHPDKCGEKPELCQQKTIDIIEAYNLLIEYIENYRFSFDNKNDSHNTAADDWWVRQFGNDPMWGQNI